jgi:hypothetical protein
MAISNSTATSPPVGEDSASRGCAEVRVGDWLSPENLSALIAWFPKEDTFSKRGQVIWGCYVY